MMSRVYTAPFRSLVLTTTLAAMLSLQIGCGGGSGMSAPVSAPTASVHLSVSSLTFTQSAGATVASQSVILTNSGTVALTIAGITLGGTDPSDFSQSSTCGASLAAGADCTVTVSFTATAAGGYSASLILSDNAGGSPQSVVLNGTVAEPALTLTLGNPSVAYGKSVAVTATATSWATPSMGTVTFYGGNTGAVPIGMVSLSNDSASFSYTPTVSGTVSISAVLTSGTDSVTSQTLPLTVTPTAITTNFTNPAAWTMSNGIVTVTYDPQTFVITHLTAVVNGVTEDIVDSTVNLPNIGHGSSKSSIYALFSGDDSSGTQSDGTSHNAVGSNYIDFWQDQPVDATSTAEVENHWVLAEGFSGLILYSVIHHSATDAVFSDFRDTYVFLPTDLDFTSLYYSDYSFNSLGQFSANFPSYADEYAASQVGDPGCNPICSGRNVGVETIEYTGLPTVSNIVENYVMASGATGTIDRNFITKYDYTADSEFESQNPHGYVSTGGVAEWAVFPTMETHTSGPGAVDIMGVSQGPGMMTMTWSSDHLGGAQYTAPQGVDSSRFVGPMLYYINGTASATPQTIPSEAGLQADAEATVAPLLPIFAGDTTMVNDGYIPLTSTTQRASATVTVANPSGWSATPYANLAILSDPATNFQASNVGYQYWSYLNPSGQATFSNVRPGTYRLSVYQRGQWGELRDDGVALTAGNSANIGGLTFTPENFGSAAPIWTIGTPDRSAHEFEYGHVANGGPDLNQFLAAYDYWGDLAGSPVPGAVVYYATADGSHPATGNLNAFPYNLWNIFDPNLYAGLFDPVDQTDDGYDDVVATTAPYVGGTPATYTSPPWQIHFTVASAQIAQGPYVDISIGLVAQVSDLFVTLNGSPQIIWRPVASTSADDPMQRSGVTGRYSWAVFEFPSSTLVAGGDNVLTLSCNHAWGVMWDALRMEISPTSANPAVTGWHDYAYFTSATSTLPNDAVPNN